MTGTAVQLYTLRNHAGMEARITNYGGIVTYLTAPDREGRYADMVLGYDSLDQYLKTSPYFGALIVAATAIGSHAENSPWTE